MRIFSRYGFVLALVLFWNIAYAEDTDDEYEIIDGINVRKDSIIIETKQDDKKGKKKGQTDSEGSDEVTQEDRDDDDEDDDEVDDDDDSDDGGEEDLASARHLPKKCHGKSR